MQRVSQSGSEFPILGKTEPLHDIKIFQVSPVCFVVFYVSPDPIDVSCD